ncbi:hypothetical protein BKA65DRAFT_174981 [Rhexocercosporidium sp. MPI-PUGE-AT-0058]|nr:hypothetical protein BKA65DRAFT_174981 [Rhexocercosporidium sp. MPI-PUGE-AT-0058]
MKSIWNKLKDKSSGTPQGAIEGAGRRESHFHEAIRQASLVQLNVAIEVMRPYSKDSKVYEEHKAPLSILLEEGKDAAVAHNYSFQKFKEVFQEKMDDWTIENLDPVSPAGLRHAIDMSYGHLYWESGIGDMEKVFDQDSFAVALNGLYLKRGASDHLDFLYRPEYEEERRLRQMTDLAKGTVENRSSSLPADASKPGMGEENRPTTSSSSQISPRTPWHRKAGSLPGQSSAHTPEPGLERVPTQQSANGAKKTQLSIKALLRAVKGPESKAEERERFRSLYSEKNRASYKRGGNDKEISVEEIRRISAADHEVIEGEADDIEQHSEEDEGDVENADRIVAKLQELTKLPGLAQVDAPGSFPGNAVRWKECCAMFRCNPRNTGIDQRLKIAGLNTRIYQYQALGVYWQMITARELGGGFLADDMGLGKTLSFLAYVVVERQLAVLERAVIKSREAKDGKHLLEGQDGVCPTPPTEGWIICPCSSSSPTSKMHLQPGLRMVCVPSPVVRQWWKQWTLHVDTTDSTLGLKLVVDHPPTFQDFTLTSAEFKMKADGPSKTRMEAKKAPKDSQKNDEPQVYNECFLLLTTQETFPKLVKEFSKTEGYTHNPKEPGAWIKTSRQNRCSLIFGIAMIDECHEEYFKNTGRAKILTDLPRFNSDVRPFLFGYSGTPFSQTPRGIEGVLWAIEKHSNTVEEAFSWAKLDKICKEFDAQLKNEMPDLTVVDSCLADFKLFMTRFMIRRTADTVWFGHPLIEVKPHIHTDILLETNETYEGDIRDYEKQFDDEREKMLESLQLKWDSTAPDLRRTNIRPTKLGFNVMIRAHWRARLLATFPYLYEMALPNARDPLSLTPEEALVFLKASPRDSNQYKKHLRSIVENSPKCLWLYNFIHELKKSTDIEGNQHRLVIMTSFPQVAYVLSLFVLKYFPEYKDLLGVVAGKMKRSDKTTIINAFTDTVEGNESKKNKKEVRILIGLTRAIGVGLQLQKACHVVLMEPDYEFVNELQAYGRVHRIGQKNPFSRSYRLIDGGSYVETLILKRQEDRKEVAGTLINEQEVMETEGRLRAIW